MKKGEYCFATQVALATKSSNYLTMRDYLVSRNIMPAGNYKGNPCWRVSEVEAGLKIIIPEKYKMTERQCSEVQTTKCKNDAISVC